MRLISDTGNVGVIATYKALQMAKEQHLDLVEISSKTYPPVCKILNYNKFKYSQKKKEKENKSKSQRIITKEIRYGPNTSEHDFNFKLKHAKEFLQDGFRVKMYVHFAGRSIVFKERGEHLLLRLIQKLEEYGKIERMPVLEGKRMHVLLTPLSTQKSKKKLDVKDLRKKEEGVKKVKGVEEGSTVQVKEGEESLTGQGKSDEEVKNKEIQEEGKNIEKDENEIRG